MRKELTVSYDSSAKTRATFDKLRIEVQQITLLIIPMSSPTIGTNVEPKFIQSLDETNADKIKVLR